MSIEHVSTAAKPLLVIDDEPDFRQLISRVGSGLGYDVVAAKNAEEFKAAYESTRPLAIILDIVMPEVDGIELLQWLAKRDCPVKIIVVTGFNPHYARMAKVLGGAHGLRVATLEKPIELDDLQAELDGLA